MLILPLRGGLLLLIRHKEYPETQVRMDGWVDGLIAGEVWASPGPRNTSVLSTFKGFQVTLG